MDRQCGAGAVRPLAATLYEAGQPLAQRCFRRGALFRNGRLPPHGLCSHHTELWNGGTVRRHSFVRGYGECRGDDGDGRLRRLRSRRMLERDQHLAAAPVAAAGPVRAQWAARAARSGGARGLVPGRRRTRCVHLHPRTHPADRGRHRGRRTGRRYLQRDAFAPGGRGAYRPGDLQLSDLHDAVRVSAAWGGASAAGDLRWLAGGRGRRDAIASRAPPTGAPASRIERGAARHSRRGAPAAPGRDAAGRGYGGGVGPGGDSDRQSSRGYDHPGG